MAAVARGGAQLGTPRRPSAGHGPTSPQVRALRNERRPERPHRGAQSRPTLQTGAFLLILGRPLPPTTLATRPRRAQRHGPDAAPERPSPSQRCRTPELRRRGAWPARAARRDAPAAPFSPPPAAAAARRLAPARRRDAVNSSPARRARPSERCGGGLLALRSERRGAQFLTLLSDSVTHEDSQKIIRLSKRVTLLCLGAAQPLKPAAQRAGAGGEGRQERAQEAAPRKGAPAGAGRGDGRNGCVGALFAPPSRQRGSGPEVANHPARGCAVLVG